MGQYRIIKYQFHIIITQSAYMKNQQPILNPQPTDPVDHQSPQKQPQPQLVTQFPSYNVIQLVFIIVRLLCSGIIMCFVILFQQYVRPRIMIPAIRRYISCIVNLISVRFVLLILGFVKFQCENYRYFDKMSRTLTYRSGWVGVAPWRNFLDFLYFSYLFNPVYARIIEFHTGVIKNQQQQVKLFYTPLSFKQAFFAALSYRGFDPIIIHNEKQLKQYKRRKMLMPTLISQCFQQLNGPILFFLPYLGYKQRVKTHKILGEDMYDNQRRFQRSGITFISQIQQFHSLLSSMPQRTIPHFSTKTYLNQLIFLSQICSQVKVNIYTVSAIQILKYKIEYMRENYSQFVDQTYLNNGNHQTIDMTYQQYKNAMDLHEDTQQRQQREREENYHQKINQGQIYVEKENQVQKSEQIQMSQDCSIVVEVSDRDRGTEMRELDDSDRINTVIQSKLD